MKHISINLPKYVLYLYDEIYKISMRKIKEDLLKWRDMSGTWIG